MKSLAHNTLLRTDLSYYTEYTSHGLWKPARHLDFLCRKLEAVERGEIKRLIVTMPPRHGKSEVISKSFPSWCIGKHPDWDIIISSYGASLAESHSEVCRDRFAEFAPEIFGVRLSKSSSSVSEWGVEGHRGTVIAAGVDGAITGKGAHIAIIDDPLKNMKEARSPTIRETVKEWYRTTLRTRLAPGGAIILVLTRWHQDDLAGYLLNEMEAGTGEQWDVFNLPAIAEDDDALGRAPGDPLWPERFSLQDLEATKGSTTLYEWNALYQQHPSDPEGGLFKREFFRYYSAGKRTYTLHAPEGDRHLAREYLTIFQTCDPAGSLKSSADWFVISTWGKGPAGDLLLLDVFRTRIEGPDHLANLTSQAAKWRPAKIGVEPANLGKTTYQTAVRSSLPVVPLNPDADKYTRALTIAAYYENGTVWHPRDAPWLDEWEEELAAFPTGAHDDQVDTAAYAGIMFYDIRAGRGVISSPDDIL